MTDPAWEEAKRLRALDRARVPHNTAPFTIKYGHSYYWIVEGPVPLHVAEAIYADPASDHIRVAGHCGCPAPVDPWITWRMPDGTTLTSRKEGDNFAMLAARHVWAKDAMKDYTFSDDPDVKAQVTGYIDTYHIDSELGLRVFIDYLRWFGCLS